MPTCASQHTPEERRDGEEVGGCIAIGEQARQPAGMRIGVKRRLRNDELDQTHGHAEQPGRSDENEADVPRPVVQHGRHQHHGQSGYQRQHRTDRPRRSDRKRTPVRLLPDQFQCRNYRRAIRQARPDVRWQRCQMKQDHRQQCRRHEAGAPRWPESGSGHQQPCRDPGGKQQLKRQLRTGMRTPPAAQ